MKLKIITLILGMIFLNSIYAQNPNSKTSFKDFKGFDKEGHRGSRGLLPENTIPSMIEAIDQGMTTLEMDLQITKDKKVIVSHDWYFNHNITTLPDGSFLTEEEALKRVLYTMTYDSIKKYDVGLKPHPFFPIQKKIAVQKPLLSELLEACEKHAKNKGTSVFYNIEIKSQPLGDGINHPEIEEFVDLAMKVILDKNLENKVVIQSFDNRPLQVMNKKYPEVATSLLVEDFDNRNYPKMLSDLGFTPTVFSPYYTTITKETIKFWHKRGVKVVPWTVNDLESMKKLKKLGVDGIITDYPDILSKLK